MGPKGGIEAAGRVLGLHARQMAVSQVLVNGADAKFTLVDHQSFLVPEKQRELRELSTLAAYRTKAFKTSQEEGELRIDLPRELVLPLRVRVFFMVSEPQGGAWFRWPRGEEKDPHMYTLGRAGEASCFFPCLNVPSARAAFELTVTTESHLVVVASGAMDAFPLEENQRITRTFRTLGHCAARDIFFAVGPFVAHVDPKLPSFTHYCMPGSEALVQYSVACFADIKGCFEKTLALPPMPISGFSSLFLADVPHISSPFHGGALFSEHLLFSKEIIDQHLESVYEMAAALGEQWVSAFQQVDEWGEMWIVQGMAQLLAYLFMRTYEHTNNSRWRLMALTEEFVNMPMDIVARPLYIKDPGHAADMFLPFVAKKSLLILTMLHRRVNETQFKDALAALFAKSAMYSTRSFLERIADATKHVTDDIERFWVLRGGYLCVSCGFSWNQKRHYLEFALKQDYNVAKFAGNLPVRVQELDGKFNHEIYFDDVKPYAWDDFPVHARPPQKKKKRVKKGENAEGGEGGGGDGAATAPAVGTATPIAASAEKSVKFNTAEITSDEKEVCPIMFLRVDPDAQWIAKVSFHQPFEMWINLIDTERDVSADKEAVRALRDYRTASSIERLAEMLNDPDVYFRIRMEAAASLAALAGADTEWKSAAVLVSYYRETHYSGNTLKGNDFSDFAKYYVSRAVLEALSYIVKEDGFSYAPGAALILDVLAHNDNSLNAYSDYMFVHSALLAASRLVLHAESLDHAALSAQVDRYSKLADLLPSYHSQLKVSVLQCRMNRAIAGTGPFELQQFRRVLFNSTHAWPVRCAAGDALFRVALKRGAADEAERVLLELVGLAENAKEPPIVRVTVLEQAAAAVRAHNQAMQWTIADGGGEVARLFCSPQHAKLAEKLWLLVAGPPFAFWEQMRMAATGLYSALWGLDTPPQLGMPSGNVLLANRSAAPQEAPTAAMTTQKDKKGLGDWRQAIGGQAPIVAAASAGAPKTEPKPELPASPQAKPAAAPVAAKLKLVLPVKHAEGAAAPGEPDAKKVKLEPPTQ